MSEVVACTIQGHPDVHGIRGEWGPQRAVFFAPMPVTLCGIQWRVGQVSLRRMEITCPLCQLKLEGFDPEDAAAIEAEIGELLGV